MKLKFKTTREDTETVEIATPVIKSEDDRRHHIITEETHFTILEGKHSLFMETPVSSQYEYDQITLKDAIGSQDTPADVVIEKLSAIRDRISNLISQLQNNSSQKAA